MFWKKKQIISIETGQKKKKKQKENMEGIGTKHERKLKPKRC